MLEFTAVIRVPIELFVEQAAPVIPASVHLSRREGQIFPLVVNKRLADKEIATVVNLSVRTVKFHVSALLTKFKVKSRHELAWLFGEKPNG